MKCANRPRVQELNNHFKALILLDLQLRYFSFHIELIVSAQETISNARMESPLEYGDSVTQERSRHEVVRENISSILSTLVIIDSRLIHDACGGPFNTICSSPFKF